MGRRLLSALPGGAEGDGLDIYTPVLGLNFAQEQNVLHRMWYASGVSAYHSELFTRGRGLLPGLRMEPPFWGKILIIKCIRYSSHRIPLALFL